MDHQDVKTQNSRDLPDKLTLLSVDVSGLQMGQFSDPDEHGNDQKDKKQGSKWVAMRKNEKEE